MFSLVTHHRIILNQQLSVDTVDADALRKKREKKERLNNVNLTQAITEAEEYNDE